MNLSSSLDLKGLLAMLATVGGETGTGTGTQAETGIVTGVPSFILNLGSVTYTS